MWSVLPWYDKGVAASDQYRDDTSCSVILRLRHPGFAGLMCGHHKNPETSFWWQSRVRAYTSSLSGITGELTMAALLQL
jgi:hypothetical protein